MTLLLVFAVTLLGAVLLSALAHRSVLSTAVLFLVVGAVAGPGLIGWIAVYPSDDLVRVLAELALFSVLFTDGMAARTSELRRAWRLPGRALLFGLPLTLGAIAVLAHYLAGLSWLEASLLGAVLSPTDPVFAAAIVGREEVPARLRQLLNVESGLNDGLALPVVVVLVAIVADTHVGVGVLLGQLALGVVLGVAVPAIFAALERLPFLSAAAAYEPLGPVAVGLILLGLAHLTGANEFLAAYVGGITMASLMPTMVEAFHRFGEAVTELLKLAALLVLGALVTPSLLAGVGLGGYLLAVAVLVLARPLAIGLSLAGSHLPWKEQTAAAWFGPKGFASVVYGLLVLEAGRGHARQLFALTAITVILSILAHSSTDVVVARILRDVDPADSR